MMCFLNLRLKKITKIRPLGNTFKYSGDINKILKENKDNSLITIYKASNLCGNNILSFKLVSPYNSPLSKELC